MIRSYRGYFSGTKRVVLLQPQDAPRTVSSFRGLNLDSASHSFYLAYTDGRTEIVHDQELDVAASGKFRLLQDEVLVVNPGESLVGYIDATHTTTAPTWYMAVEEAYGHP